MKRCADPGVANVSLIFHYYPNRDGGNAMHLNVGVFRRDPEGWRFLGLVPVYGYDPRDVTFGPGRIDLTTTMQGPNDPPHEGLHTFYNARERMRRRYREGEVGKWYVLGWYIYHLCTLWTLPFHITEWEVGRVKRMHQRNIPEAMRAWSEPLSSEQWVKPSAELLRQRELLANLRQRNPQGSIFDLMAEVGRMIQTNRKQAGAAKR
mgnify:FL=1